MILITKKNISEELLAELTNQVVMLETKYGIKQIVVETTKVNPRRSRRTDRSLNGYLLRIVQGPHLLRSDNYALILHGIAEDVVRFIKTDDYSLDGEGHE